MLGNSLYLLPKPAVLDQSVTSVFRVQNEGVGGTFLDNACIAYASAGMGIIHDL